MNFNNDEPDEFQRAYEYAEKAAHLLNLGNFEEAIKYCDMSLEIVPDIPEVLYNRALASGRSRRFQEAANYFEKFLKINPNDGEAWFNLGLTFKYLNNRAKAMECAKKAANLGFRP